MPLFVRSLKILSVCLALFVGAELSYALAEVTIQTRDGRVISGEVDAETDGKLLWIRQEKEQIQLTTSVRWNEIVAAFAGEAELPVDQLAEILGAQATEAAPLRFVHQVSYQQPAVCENCGPQPQAGIGRLTPRSRVRSLDIEAYLVNMDRDVEPDGLELVVAAVDERGLPVPVSGSLSARLWGERIQPHGSLVRYEDLQRWSQRVRTEDFDADGLASYRLRFRTINPELDRGLHSDALINVRLSVSGQGNFEASVPVQIRAFNPVRDRLQLTRGGRFLPDELTQRTRRQLPHRTHTRSLRSR